MADIKRPEFLRSNSLAELLRWQKHTTDNIDRLNLPLGSIKLTRITAQEIPNNTPTAIEYTAQEYIEGESFEWRSTNPSVLTLKRSGRLVITLATMWEVLVGGNFRNHYAIVTRDEVELTGARAYSHLSGASYAGMNSSEEFEVLSGDELRVYAYHDQGAALDVSPYGAALPNMLIARYTS